MPGFIDAQKAVALDTFITAQSTNIYVALFTTNPVEDGTGGVEADYTSYARVQHTAWNAATVADPSVKTNNGTITFPIATGGANTITGWAIFSASSGGSPLFQGTCSLAVSTGITPAFADTVLELQQS